MKIIEERFFPDGTVDKRVISIDGDICFIESYYTNGTVCMKGHYKRSLGPAFANWHIGYWERGVWAPTNVTQNVDKIFFLEL